MVASDFIENALDGRLRAFAGNMLVKLKNMQVEVSSNSLSKAVVRVPFGTVSC